MRDARIMPAIIAATLSLSITACSKPEAVRSVQAPPRTASAPMGGAEKLQRLNIMLMVTALRCRKTSDDFMADYRRFSSEQSQSLESAGAFIRNQYLARYGATAGNAAYERLGTSMANNYGQGHPWLNCRQLKLVAKNLASVQGSATLVEAADQLLARRGSEQFAWSNR